MMQLLQRVLVIAAIGGAIGLAHSAVWRNRFGKGIFIPPPTQQTPAPAGSSSGDTPQGTASPTQPAQTEPAQPAQAAAGYSDVTIDQARALFGEQACFIDARDMAEFEQGHVQGAFQATADMLRAKSPLWLQAQDPGKPVVIYCGGGMCDASKNVAVVLGWMGFTDLRIMNDGYPAWRDAGHPTATGRPDIED